LCSISVSQIACFAEAALAAKGAPLSQRVGSSLSVNFAGDEIALLIEMVMDLGEFLQLRASKPLEKLQRPLTSTLMGQYFSARSRPI
jgi:hypothetical protein